MTTPRPELAEAVSALPGMRELLPALAGAEPTHLVGGAVRDLLRDSPSLDLDLVVEGDAVAVAQDLSDRLGGVLTVHERFGTATVDAAGLTLDLAFARREHYPAPGALPEVEPAGLGEDLARRDFTVNAMAVALNGPDVGELQDPVGGRDDLRAGLVRVLHDRSFSDDPTRLLRAVRYEARLGFTLDPATERLARDAAHFPLTVSGPRIRDELMDLLGEPEAPAAVGRMRELGIAGALHPGLDADPDRVAGAALASWETGADPALASLAALCGQDPDAVEQFVAGLSLGAGRAESVLRAVRRGPQLAQKLRRSLRPSELHELLAGEPPESLALALALGAPGEPVLRYLTDLRGTSLEITGEDLLEAGVPRSPALGRALRETLRRKLDGELSGREAELRAAIDLAGRGA